MLRHHPWIFSGAIASIDGNPTPGETVCVHSEAGKFLALGGYSPQSQIRVRIYSFEDLSIDADFLATRIKAALIKRNFLKDNPARNAYRLIYGESDGLPGLVVDKYGDILVCQFLFVGMEIWRTVLIEKLAELTGCQGIYDRSDVHVRLKEGLSKSHGVIWGNVSPDPVIIIENGRQYTVDIVAGQKTGFYLDQSVNRSLVGSLCEGRHVLNCFSYTGGFSIAALQGGAAHVISVDSSAPALAMAEKNIQLNNFSEEQHTTVEANAFTLLREWQKQSQKFDMIILDPPKFAENKSQVMKAARAYKDLALQAAPLVNPGGLLVTFSCSGGIETSLFQKITADALLDANRQGEIIQYLHQAPDHPVSLAFPESQYLKGLVCRIN